LQIYIPGRYDTGYGPILAKFDFKV